MYFGLSLFFEYLTVFKGNKDVNYKVQFTDELIQSLRKGQEKYYTYLKNYLVEECSKIDNVLFDDGSDYDLLPPKEVDLSGQCILFDPNENSDLKTNYNLPEKYIVINTKIGRDGTLRKKWSQIRDKYFNY